MDLLILDCGAINGESTIKGYEQKIEVLSFSHSVAQQITGDQSNEKRTSGKPNHQDFTVTKYLDIASPSLIDYCNQAKLIATVKLTIGQSENGNINPYMVYTLTDALVSSVSVGGGGGGKPQETITFNYRAIAWEYTLPTAEAANTVTGSAKWNLATNLPS